MKTLNKLWQEFALRPFPDGYAGVEVEGIELASVDSFAAGCIDTFIRKGGSLDADRIAVLDRCARQLDVVVEKLDGEANDYFEQLQLLSREVLRLAR